MAVVPSVQSPAAVPRSHAVQIRIVAAPVVPEVQARLRKLLLPHML